MHCYKSKIMAWINWKCTKSCISNSTKRYLINRSAQGYPSRLTLSCSVGGRFSGSSRRRSGRRRHPNMTQAPRCHPRLVDRKFCICPALCSSEDFALFSLWSYTHSRIQPPTRLDLLESSTKTTAGTDVRVHRLLRPKSFPFRDRVVAFIPRSFIPRAGKSRDQSHDVDCTPSSIRQISRYLHHDLKISW